MKATSVTEEDLRVIASLAKLHAASVAYVAGQITLFDASRFAWQEVQAAAPAWSPTYLMDLIRIYRRRYEELVGIDNRIREISQVRSEFPQLFTAVQPFEVPRGESELPLVDQHPYGRLLASSAERQENSEYAAYWVQSCWPQLLPSIMDHRFLAALDAFRQDYLSYVGFLEKLYGDPGHVLFPAIGWEWSKWILGELGGLLGSERLPIPTDLREAHPEFYQTYNPEAYGR